MCASVCACVQKYIYQCLNAYGRICRFITVYAYVMKYVRVYNHTCMCTSVVYRWVGLCAGVWGLSACAVRCWRGRAGPILSHSQTGDQTVWGHQVRGAWILLAQAPYDNGWVPLPCQLFPQRIAVTTMKVQETEFNLWWLTSVPESMAVVVFVRKAYRTIELPPQDKNKNKQN